MVQRISKRRHELPLACAERLAERVPAAVADADVHRHVRREHLEQLDEDRRARVGREHGEALGQIRDRVAPQPLDELGIALRAGGLSPSGRAGTTTVSFANGDDRGSVTTRPSASTSLSIRLDR